MSLRESNKVFSATKLQEIQRDEDFSRSGTQPTVTQDYTIKTCQRFLHINNVNKFNVL